MIRTTEELLKDAHDVKDIREVFNTHFSGKKRNKRRTTDLLDDLLSVKQQLERMIMFYEREDIKDGGKPDRRKGVDTYGFDNWLSQMDYIAFKWRCQFRVQWILDLLVHLKPRRGTEWRI